MKWWHWLILELLIIFGVITWIYFFPSEIEVDFTKGMIGFVLFYATENCRDINRRKTMDYKEGMTCGKCLKYEFCPVANHNTNHKACMKITTKENHTIEQNAGENRIEGGVVSISGSVNPLYDQLQSYESYINDIPLVIYPCKMCKIYKAKGGYDTGHFDSDGQWDDSNSCKMCCWYYDSKFEVSV